MAYDDGAKHPHVGASFPLKVSSNNHGHNLAANAASARKVFVSSPLEAAKGSCAFFESFKRFNSVILETGANGAALAHS